MQLKQIRADISVDSVQKKLIDDEDALTLGKKKFLLQRFIDAISLDKKLFNFQPVAEFFGLNRDPDKVIPPLKVNDWKVAAESDKAEVEKAVKDIVLEHKLAMEVNSSLTSTILILNNTIQESSARIKKLELDERAHVMEEKLWSVKTESIKEWALSSIDQLNEEIKIKQEQITVLVKTCNGLSIENEKLREELRKTNAKFTAYEKSAREEIARNEYLRARVFELETENASLATRLTRLRERNTGSTTETATDGSETKESEQQQQQQQQGDLVRRIKELEEANKELTIAKFESDKACHEAAALRLEVIKLNRVIESIKAENEAHARETTDMLSSLIKKEKDSKIFADKCTTENKQLK